MLGFLLNVDRENVERKKPSFAGGGRAQTMTYFHQYIYSYI